MKAQSAVLREHRPHKSVPCTRAVSCELPLDACYLAAPMHRRPAARNLYDHNIRNAVCATGDPRLFDGVPLSTGRSWIRRGPANVVSFGEDTSALLARIQHLQRINARLRNVIRLLLALTRAFGFSLEHSRMPDADRKRLLMRAVDRAAAAMPRSHALRVLGMTPARLSTWQQAEIRCALDDAPSCPRSRPTRTSARERFAIKLLVTSDAFAHFSIRALALYAQRLDIVHLGVGTWYRLIRRHEWNHPRLRIHPRVASIGLRASRVGQYLHIDITELRLLDGSRAYIQAILDNFSRAILAYDVASSKTADQTSRLLRDACAALGIVAADSEPILVADDGGENKAEHPDVAAALLDTGSTLHIAGVDLLCSNSMIERFWMSLKHNFLYTRRLDSFSALRRFVDFFIHQHNNVMPHYAFQGHTPAEVFLGFDDDLPQQLAQKRLQAKDARIAHNRRAACGACTPAHRPPDQSVP